MAQHFNNYPKLVTEAGLIVATQCPSPMLWYPRGHEQLNPRGPMGAQPKAHGAALQPPELWMQMDRLESNW